MLVKGNGKGVKIANRASEVSIVAGMAVVEAISAWRLHQRHPSSWRETMLQNFLRILILRACLKRESLLPKSIILCIRK